MQKPEHLMFSLMTSQCLKQQKENKKHEQNQTALSLKKVLIERDGD